MGNRSMFVGLDVHKETIDVSIAARFQPRRLIVAPAPSAANRVGPRLPTSNDSPSGLDAPTRSTTRQVMT